MLWKELGMIELPNGHKLDFLAASGALGFTGFGYLWEQPFTWLGYLRPEEFTVITKTLTFKKRRGKFNWLCPWRTFRPLAGGAGFINNMGLPNPGCKNWIKDYYPQTRKNKVIVSITPFNVNEAVRMIEILNPLKIIGIEINLHCPNVKPVDEVDIVYAVIEKSHHPIILKLGYGSRSIDLCKHFDGSVAAFDLINSVPSYYIASPVIEGSFSGNIIAHFSRYMLTEVKKRCQTPIISGGGIDSIEEVYTRFAMGAKAVSIGTMFLKKPWLPNQIVSQCRREMKNII